MASYSPYQSTSLNQQLAPYQTFKVGNKIVTTSKGFGSPSSSGGGASSSSGSVQSNNVSTVVTLPQPDASPPAFVSSAPQSPTTLKGVLASNVAINSPSNNYNAYSSFARFQATRTGMGTADEQKYKQSFFMGVAPPPKNNYQPPKPALVQPFNFSNPFETNIPLPKNQPDVLGTIGFGFLYAGQKGSQLLESGVNLFGGSLNKIPYATTPINTASAKYSLGLLAYGGLTAPFTQSTLDLYKSTFAVTQPEGIILRGAKQTQLDTGLVQTDINFAKGNGELGVLRSFSKIEELPSGQTQSLTTYEGMTAKSTGSLLPRTKGGKAFGGLQMSIATPKEINAPLNIEYGVFQPSQEGFSYQSVGAFAKAKGTKLYDTVVDPITGTINIRYSKGAKFDYFKSVGGGYQSEELTNVFSLTKTSKGSSAAMGSIKDLGESPSAIKFFDLKRNNKFETNINVKYDATPTTSLIKTYQTNRANTEAFNQLLNNRNIRGTSNIISPQALSDALSGASAGSKNLYNFGYPSYVGGTGTVNRASGLFSSRGITYETSSSLSPPSSKTSLDLRSNGRTFQPTILSVSTDQQQNQRQGQGLITKQVSPQTQVFKQVAIPNLSTGQDTIVRQQQKYGQALKFNFGTTQTDSTPSSFFNFAKTGGGFGALILPKASGIKTNKLYKPIKISQPTRYQPSFTAILLNIKGKKPKYIKGIGYNPFATLPIVSRGRTKKKRK